MGLLGEKLEKFSKQNNDNIMDNSIIIGADLTKVKKKKKNDDDDEMTMLDILDNDFEELSDFDSILEDLMEIDEDSEIRESLIRQGRKFNQTYSKTAEQTEIERSFSNQEMSLGQLVDSLNKDINAIETDINNLRLSRSKSPKALADLVSTKGSLYATKLSAIKESINLRKNIHELNMKQNKNNNQEDQASMAATIALQQMIEGDTRNALSDSDYRNIAKGSLNSAQSRHIDIGNIDTDIDELLIEKEFSDSDEGDKYIKYENMNVEIYALVDDNDDIVNLIAKDKDGNIVDDYPIPSIENNSFTVHHDLGTVSDTFHRTYILEKI